MGNALKKSHAALIVLIGFIGVILASSSNLPIRKMSGLELIAETKREWQVSALLLKGETIVVQIDPRTGDDGWWRSLVRFPFMHLYISIIGPHDKTIFKVYYTSSESISPGYTGEPFGMPPEMSEFPISVLNYTLVKEGEDFEVRYEYLKGTKYIKQIAGTVKAYGNYTVKIEHINDWNWPRNEPDSIAIFKEVYVTVYPYKSLLPIGIAILAFDGLCTCIVWRRNKSKMKKISKYTKVRRK